LKLAGRMAALEPSATLAMAARAGALKAAGCDVIDLSVGEPDFPTPEHICRAGQEAITAGFTKYTPAAGIPALRKAVAEDYTRRSGLAVTPAQVVVSSGAKHALHNVFTALLDEGDEVVVPAPYWVSYAELVKLKSKRGVDALHAKVATLEADLEKLRAKRGTGALQVRIDALKDENAFLYGRIAAMGGDKWELEQVTGPGGATMLSELTVQVESARSSVARLIQQLNVARTSVGQLVQQLELVRAENGRLAVLVHDFVQKERAATAEPSWRDIVEPRASAASLWRDSDSEVWSFPADGPHFVRP
jgi:hypothetical protein